MNGLSDACPMCVGRHLCAYHEGYRDATDALEAERDRLREAVQTVLPWLEFRARSTDRSGDEFRSASDLLGAALSVGETTTERETGEQ